MDNREILSAALVGLEIQLDHVGTAILDIRHKLGQRGPGRPPAASMNGTEPTPARRKMSAAARRRIAMAQKKRWAAVKAEKAEPKTQATVKPKRKMSKAGRKAIVEATKKRWAAFRKAQKAVAVKKAPKVAAKKAAPKPKARKRVARKTIATTPAKTPAPVTL